MSNNQTHIAITHAFFWLMVANAVGLLMSLLLLIPGLGELSGSLGYGRWVPVHLNLQLYGWTSLPLIAWLLHSYQPASRYSSSVIWLWSASLLTGSLHWLSGHSSGKIFLDWQGPALSLFIVTLFALWILLFTAWCRSPQQPRSRLQGLALLGLFCIPFALMAATSPALFPPVNKDTGGPTGSSLLGSTLIVIALFLILPPVLARAKKSSKLLRVCWILFVVEMLAFVLLERQPSTHHDPLQIIALGSLLPWTYLLPKLWSQYQWKHANSCWRTACFLWFFLLVLSGWLTFLPGILDRLKFTNGLVAHAHLAMAGFTTSFLIHLSAQITPERFSKALFHKPACLIWNSATLGYILLMWAAGWLEGGDFGWLIHPTDSISGKTVLYGLRSLCGAAMLGTAGFWWYQLQSYSHHHHES